MPVTRVLPTVLLRPSAKLVATVLVAAAATGGVAASADKVEHLPTLRTAEASAPRKISAYFLTGVPSTTADNVKLLQSMRTDAITFGFRVLPASKSTFPAPVRSLIGKRRAFMYSGGGDWNKAALRSSDRRVTVNGVLWTVMDTRGGTVVVSKAGGDRFKALNAAGNTVGADTIIGLPAPKAGSANGVAYLPDTSYLPTMAEFTKRFVIDARAEGADGFYQHVEMPVTDSPFWSSVRNLYAVQNKAVNAASPRATVIISPFLESRRAKAEFTPAQAARGARMLLGTANGTRLIIAPQDGLGVGSTALSADKASGRVAPLESYLAAMRKAIGSHLWNNIEVMKPGPNGTRKVTTRTRVSQQLWTEARYSSGTIAFIWDDSSRGIGAKRVPGGVTGWSKGFGTTVR